MLLHSNTHRKSSLLARTGLSAVCVLQLRRKMRTPRKCNAILSGPHFSRACLCAPAFTVRLHIGNLLVDHDYKLPEHSNAFIIESQLNVYDIVLNALVRVRLTDTPHAHVHEVRQLCYGFTANTERTIHKGCHTGSITDVHWPFGQMSCALYYATKIA